jgi:hypothetical protein
MIRAAFAAVSWLAPGSALARYSVNPNASDEAVMFANVILGVFFASLFVWGLASSEKVMAFRARRTIRQKLANSPELQERFKGTPLKELDLPQVEKAQKEIKAAKDEERFQEFKRRVEQERQSRF